MMEWKWWKDSRSDSGYLRKSTRISGINWKDKIRIKKHPPPPKFSLTQKVKFCGSSDSGVPAGTHDMSSIV